MADAGGIEKLIVVTVTVGPSLQTEEFVAELLDEIQHCIDSTDLTGVPVTYDYE